MKIAINTAEVPTKAERKMVEAWLSATDDGAPAPPSWQYELALARVAEGIAIYCTGDYKVVDGELQLPLDADPPVMSIDWQLPPDTPAPKVVTALLAVKPAA